MMEMAVMNKTDPAPMGPPPMDPLLMGPPQTGLSLCILVAVTVHAMFQKVRWGVVGSGTPAMHRHTAWGQWAVELLQCTATLPVGSGQWNSSNAPPHCLGAVGTGTPAKHSHTACGQSAVAVL